MTNPFQVAATADDNTRGAVEGTILSSASRPASRLARPAQLDTAGGAIDADDAKEHGTPPMLSSYKAGLPTREARGRARRARARHARQQQRSLRC